MGEVASLNPLLMHPYVTSVHCQIVTGRSSANNHNAAFFNDKCRDGKCRLTRMLEHHVNIDAFAGNVPYRLAKFAHLAKPCLVFRRVDFGQLPPAIEISAVDNAFGAKI